jgi:diamine N-acetyltransferase
VTLERRPVERDHVVPLIRLSVGEGQEGLVAGNAKTLAQAAYETGSHVWGLWAGDEPVGLMAMIDPRGYPWLDEGDDPGAAYLWRLMIDARHQGKGYGRQAIKEAVAVARGWGLPRLALSVVDRPGSALSFYERLGFRRTGATIEDEAVLAVEVDPQA